MSTEADISIATSTLATVTPDNKSPAADNEMPTASSYFLHTPLPNVPMSTAVTNTSQQMPGSPGSVPTSPVRSPDSGVIVSPAVPLLLDPELMKGTSIHIVSPQVHVSIDHSSMVG